ncbi:unnamed protein product [Rotaria magnacalcarata]|uniref:Reelin domain-containing protein n=2 Tax=Rotaria magnacalcarata TaxID=392030 RepID=A0A8S2RF63_9BILA|nr:unnamed protein product [Rotaria magnacalcarata]
MYHLTMNLFFFVYAACQLTFHIYAYPNGAPKKVCTGSMVPHHHHIEPQPPTTSPITKFYTAWNPDNETISIQIESNQPIKGVFVQGRKIDGDEPLGTFIDIPSVTHLVQCPTGDGITHSSPQKWKRLELTWKKPASMNSQDQVQFWATIVVDFQNFWVVKSTSTELNNQKFVMTFMNLIKKVKKNAFGMIKWTKTNILKYI